MFRGIKKDKYIYYIVYLIKVYGISLYIIYKTNTLSSNVNECELTDGS